MYDTLADLPEVDVSRLVVVVAQMFVEGANGILSIVVERDSANEVGEELPPVLPFHLVKVDMRAFSNTLRSQKDRLKETYNDEHINEIGEDFVKLKRAYREEAAFKDVVDTCNESEGQQNF